MVKFLGGAVPHVIGFSTGFRRQGGFFISPSPTRGGTLKFEGGLWGDSEIWGTTIFMRATNLLTNFYLKPNFFMENKFDFLTTKVTKIP